MALSILAALSPLALLDAAPDAVVVFDADGSIIYSNDQALILFGYVAAELLQQPIEILVPEQFREKHTAHGEFFAKNPTVRPFLAGHPLAAVKKDGTIFPAEISLAPLGQVERPIITITIIRDVTVRKQIENELAAANQALSAFNYSVAHDLMAPIRIMSGMATLLKRRYSAILDTEGKGYIQHIVEGAQEAERLTQGLLSLSKAHQGEVLPEPVDLSNLARTIVRELTLIDPDRNVAVNIENGLHAHLDPRLARSLLYNLLSNAWKFTGKNPSALIEVGQVSGEFFVRDNGVGFDPGQIKRLFVPFERLHGESFVGHGLGLAICYRIVRRHGGDIRATNHPDGGAIFYFNLPDPEIILSDLPFPVEVD